MLPFKHLPVFFTSYELYHCIGGMKKSDTSLHPLQLTYSICLCAYLVHISSVTVPLK